MSDKRLFAKEFLISESKSLLIRLEEMKPFELTMPMVRSASVSSHALKLITQLLDRGKSELRNGIRQFITFLKSEEANNSTEENLQTRFTVLKLRYNQILDQLDIFADVMSQRSEHEVGIWLSGLDVLAEDGLKIGSEYYEAPSLMVYLDRGHGAAIRRARTRLPGGDENPVAVIQIPRERMVGNGIASSLIHEVGHQGAALLDLIPSLKGDINKVKQETGVNHTAWKYYERWISEIIADFWALAQLGISSTIGLMGVVSLPSYFQFRFDLADPHPAPYIRVMLSCTFGRKLFPDEQWDNLWKLWESFYPHDKLPKEQVLILNQLGNEMDRFVDLVINNKPESLKGKRLIDLFQIQDRQPKTFREAYQTWKRNPYLIDRTSPIIVFAILGQAKADQAVSSSEESHLLKRQLNRWASQR